MNAFVYILTNKPHGTLYVGVTNNLVRRIYEHKEKTADGFTKRYDLKRLVFFEQHATMPLAIQREKNIKHWVRKWKIHLIEEQNAAWDDLWDQIVR